jgi:hypothetical protein
MMDKAIRNEKRTEKHVELLHREIEGLHAQIVSVYGKLTRYHEY